MFIPGNTMVENVRALAWSAMPDAPVEPDDPPGLLARLRDRFRARRHSPAGEPHPTAQVPAEAH